MKTKNFFDKSGWSNGPWLDEPDYLAWIDSVTEYACVARRNLTGAWCGFVGLDPDHTLYLTENTSDEFKFIDVHGTVTYTSWNQTEDAEFYPARRLWWVGFDAMQDTDFCPAFADEGKFKGRGGRKRRNEPIYRDMPYIRMQIEMLAAQLATFDHRFST